MECLGIDPYALDFGVTAPGTSVPKFVTLSDLCNAPILLWADPAVLNTGPTGTMSFQGPFQPGAGFPTKDSIIAPGQSVQVSVIFTPLTSDKFIGGLYISTDDPLKADIEIPLTGTGQ